MSAVEKAKDAVEDVAEKAKEAVRNVTGDHHSKDENDRGAVPPAIDLVDESRGAPEPDRYRS